MWASSSPRHSSSSSNTATTSLAIKLTRSSVPCVAQSKMFNKFAFNAVFVWVDTSARNACSLMTMYKKINTIVMNVAYAVTMLWMGETHRGTPANVAAHDDTARFRLHSHDLDPPSDSIKPYLEQAGFAKVAELTTLKVDSSLVLAMVERWRPETHTFHLPTGECTITLEDVSMLFGLRVNGKAVNGPTQVGSDVYLEYLGIDPPAKEKHKCSVKMLWLQTLLEQLKKKTDASDAEIILHAKIYILLLIGKVLMPDKSHNLLHSSWIPLVADFNKCKEYSWGSACLATLYRHLCRAAVVGVKSIGGCALLLSTWTFWHIPLISPETSLDCTHPYATRFVRRGMAYPKNPRHHLRGYRYSLDRLRAHDFIWRPYPDYPECVLEDCQIWSSTTYIICFHIVEMHQADRVKMQFGFEQDIPSEPRCLRDKHATDMPNTWGDHWRHVNREENREWRNRHKFILQGNMVNNNYVHSAAYMQWYLSIPFMHASQAQFLDDPRQYASSSQQQTTSSSMPQETAHMNPSQFPTQTSSIPQPTYQNPYTTQQTFQHTQTTQQHTFYATSSQQQSPFTPTPQPNLYYEQFQQQTTTRPSFQFTPISQPFFDSSYPPSQEQTFNPSFSQTNTSFRTGEVYYPPIQQIPPTPTFNQPSNPFPNYLLTDENLMDCAGFSIADVPMAETSQQPVAEDEALSSDSTPSPQRRSRGRPKRTIIPTRCGTGGHLRRQH